MCVAALWVRAGQATASCISMQELIHHIWHNDSGASTPASVVGPDSSASMGGGTEDEGECCAHTRALLAPISPLPTAVRVQGL